MCRAILFLCLFATAFVYASAATSANTVSLVIADNKRIAGETSVAVTLAFTTLGALPIDGKITLNYPSGFFATSATPANNGAGTASVADMTATSAAPTTTSIVITTAVAGIPTMTAFTITLTGLTMGVATLGSATGITVQTSSDTIASAGAASGIIGAPHTVSLAIADADRIADKGSVEVVLSFKTTTALAVNGLITLTYPSGFFHATKPEDVVAGKINGATGAMTAVPSTPSATEIILTTAVGTIAADTVFTITLTGCKMGAATLGSTTGITVKTSTADTIASAGAASGIIGAPHTVSLLIAAGDRDHLKAAVPVTLAFKTTTALAVNGKITLNYPSGFFSTSAKPADNAAGTIGGGGGTMTATSAAPTATSIVITTAVAGINADTVFTITLSGLTMGVGTAGSATGITVQTDTAGTIASAGFPSGLINTAVTTVGFVIAAAKRAPASTAAALTLSFTPTTEIQIGGKITLNYPAGFFADSITPTGAISVSTMTATYSATSSSNKIVITTSVVGAAAGTVFTITLSGLTMGAATAGGDVTIQTDRDTAKSPAVTSGGLGTSVTLFTAKPSATTPATSATTLVLAFTATTTVAIGGTISFWFPTGWYDTAAAPTNNAASSSSVATLTATSVFSGNRITITTAVAAIPVGAFTITLSGLKTGAADVAVGKFTLATSGDTVGLEIDSPALGAIAAADNQKSDSSILAVTLSTLLVSFMLLI